MLNSGKQGVFIREIGRCGCSVAGMGERDADVSLELGRGWNLHILEGNLKQIGLYSRVTGSSTKALLKK